MRSEACQQVSVQSASEEHSLGREGDGWWGVGDTSLDPGIWDRLKLGGRQKEAGKLADVLAVTVSVLGLLPYL